MEKRRRRTLVVTIAVACFGAAIGSALAVVGSAPEDPLTRAQVFQKGMSLPQIAQAATGKVGEIAPPCPPVEAAQRLKEAGIDFGPCDLVPEKGAPVRLAGPQDEPAEDDVVCPELILGKDAPLTITTACGPGAEISNASPVEVGGKPCADVSYVTERGGRSHRETLCEGDTPSGGGQPVRGPSNADEHRH